MDGNDTTIVHDDEDDVRVKRDRFTKANVIVGLGVVALLGMLHYYCSWKVNVCRRVGPLPGLCRLLHNYYYYCFGIILVRIR
jgi:hypothetical protein